MGWMGSKVTGRGRVRYEELGSKQSGQEFGLSGL